MTKSKNVLLIFLSLVVGWGIYKILFLNLNYYRGIRIARDTGEPIPVVHPILGGIRIARETAGEPIPVVHPILANAEPVEEDILQASALR